MSNWDVPLIGLTETSGANTATSLGTALSTSYTAFETTTDFEWASFVLSISSRNATANDTDFTVARGSSGNEYPIVDRIAISNLGSTYGRGYMTFFPLRVPKGERVSIKIGTSVSTFYGFLIGNAAGFAGAGPSGAFCERVGTAGTLVDLDGGGTANTKGAWVSLGSNTYPWKGCYLNAIEDSGTAAEFLVDFAIDVGGNKIIIYPDVPFQKGSGSTIGPNIIGPLYGDFPAGVAWYARCQSSTNSSTSRHIQVGLHGIV